MADLADLAASASENTIALSIESLRGRRMSPRGHCLSCREALAEQLYCDSDCRAQYEHELLVRQRTGR